MGFINSSLNSIIDSATGTSSGTNLQDFLSKFGSSAGKYADTIDPLATFDVSMRFHPTKDFISNTIKQNVLNSLGSIATASVKNLGNNITGGLLESLLNRSSVETEFKIFSERGEHTFLEYLAKANLLVGGENWFNQTQGLCPLELQLGLYVQSATIPKLKIPDNEKSVTVIGEFPINGQYVIPDNNQLQLDILCTKLPLHERIFYPWMREVTLPYWSYVTQPYTTADVIIDFSKHSDLQYVFYGCRPTQIETIQPLQEPTAPLTRQVTLTFDLMFIKSKLTTVESVTKKLLSTGKTLFNSASNAINL